MLSKYFFGRTCHFWLVIVLLLSMLLVGGIPTLYAQCTQMQVSGSATIAQGASTNIVLVNGQSQPTVSYQLKKDGVSYGSPINGNNGTLNWSVNQAGTYTVVANGGACSNTSMIGSATVTFSTTGGGGTPPTSCSTSIAINVPNNPTTVCPGSGYQLSASANASVSTIQWRLGSATSPVLSTAKDFAPTQSGLYYLTATNTDCGISQTVALQVSFAPSTGTVSVPTVASGQGAGRCQGGGTTQMTALAANAQYYTWSISAGASTITSSGAITWDANFYGTATITVRAEGCNPNSSSTSFTVIKLNPAVGGITSGTASVLMFNNQGSVNLSGQTGSVTGWQKSENGGSSWTDIGGAGQTSFAYTDLGVTTQFRAVVATTGCGASTAYSSPATLTMLRNLNWSHMRIFDGNYQATVGVSEDGLSYYSPDPITLPLSPAPPATVKKIISAQSITLSPGYELPSGSEIELVVLTTSGGVVSEGRTYSDFLGKEVQSQARSFTTGLLLANQPLYGRLGTPVGSTLLAPIGTGGFNFKDGFITSGGANYAATHFDESTKVLAPSPVDQATPNTLGWYYSDNNTLEPYVATTQYPYSRVELSDGPSAQLKRASASGDELRMGKNHEAKGRTMALLTELDAHYLKLRSHFVTTTATSLSLKGTKSVSVDANGLESIVFSDQSGQTLASCRSGAQFTPGVSISGTIEAGSATNPAYLDIHIPNTGTAVPITISAGGSVRVTNLITGNVLGSTPTSLATGFYRVESLSGTQTLSYTANYGEFRYSYYDDAGQLVASVAPKGVVLGNLNAPGFTTTYQYNASELLKTTDPDEGSSEFVYRRDGSLRFSQDAQQKNDRKFSYQNYDRVGRVLESGEYQLPNTISNTASLRDQLTAHFGASLITMLEDKTRQGGLYTNGTCTPCGQVASTWYDTETDYQAADAATLGTRKQRFLIGATAKTQNINSSSWYSYDEQGNVEWIVQSLTSLGTKTLDYTYDFRGNVLQVTYQKGQPDAFYHHYSYDADQRLSVVYTSSDGTTKVQQAKYFYYTHGPLKRVELADKLQGTDYVYTVQGWLKAINHAGGKAKDPGKDGVSGEVNAAFAPDAFGITLEYFTGDYARSGRNISSVALTNQAYYSGQIRALSWQSEKLSSVGQQATYAYSYDNKYQLQQAVWGSVDFSQASPSFTATEAFKEYGMTYDAHGNLLTLKRNNASGVLSDNFAYNYAKANTNQLTSVAGYGRAYQYDKTGQLTEETGGSFNKYLNYDASGLVTGIFSDAAKSQKKLAYNYDEAGVRIKKENTTSGLTTFYVRDGAGNVMAIYEKTGAGTPVLKELPIYATGRLGTLMVADGSTQYELKDHLGSVRAVVLRTKEGNGSAQVYNLADYSPYGNYLRGEGSAGNDYRYGYQGAYAEKEPGGETDWNAFELRMYDARIGRWLSTDPYGQYDSPYVAMGNDPANQVDPDGGFSGDPIGGILNLTKGTAQWGVVVSASRLPGSMLRNGLTALAREITLDRVQMAVDVIGYVPGLNVAASIVSAGIDVYKGDYGSAALNLAGVIPGAKVLLAVTAAAPVLLGVVKVVKKVTKASTKYDPKKIHFMQSSIKNQTGDFTVLKNAEDLKSGILDPEVLKINIWEDEAGKLWTLDHRRLAAFRLAGTKVPADLAPSSIVKQQMWKMTTKNGGKSIKLKLGDGKSMIIE